MAAAVQGRLPERFVFLAERRRPEAGGERGDDLVDKRFAGEYSKHIGQFLTRNAGLAQDRA